jgi:glycosyltransferase involved in cell wall biosynthesis
MVLMRLLERLDERFAPQVLLLGEGRFAQLLRDRGVPTQVANLPGKKGLLGFPGALRRAVARYRGSVDVIHANGTKAALFAVPLGHLLRVPVLWMKHDHFFDGFVARELAKRCDRVVCVSEAMAAQFPPAVRARTTVAYPGVHLGPLTELTGTQPLIACVGRLDPLKGFDDILRATRLLRDRGVDARVRIAGPIDRVRAGHADELERLVDELELREVAEVGWIDDLDDLYRGARVFAMASRPEVEGNPSEGAPTVLMEAMAWSRPVVAPREPGMVEVMGDGGTAYWPVTPDSIAGALEPYLRDEALAAETGRRGRARAERVFSLERTVAALEGLYADLARATR